MIRAQLRVPALTGIGVFALVLVVGSANGGYFPTTWGWIALVLCWTACVGLLLQQDVALTAGELTLLGFLSLYVTWVALSISWSQDRAQSIAEVERDLLYVVGVLAAVVVVRRSTLPHLLAGIAAGITALDAYALSTRLFPGSGARLDPIVLNQLAKPLGYPNGLGIFSVLGLFLALAFVARARDPWLRAAAGAALPVLCATLYFTYSRGAWLALFAALLVTIALDPRRLQLVTSALVVGPWSALAVWLSSRQSALTSLTGTYGETRSQGSQLCAVLLVLVAASGLTAFVLARIESTAVIREATRRRYAATVGALSLVALVLAFLHFGDPIDLTRRAYDAFRTPPSSVPSQQQFHNNLNERLFRLNGTYRTQQWRAAWDDYRAHPVLGSGAGSFEQYWLEHRTVRFKVRDAHSLYVESLGELGWAGLILLLIALGAPLLAAARVRGEPFVPLVCGAYVAYLLHAGIDWDWELPAVTLAGLFCGVALLVFARGRTVPVGGAARAGIAAGVIVLAAFSVYGLLGNRALASATRNVDAANWERGTGDAHAAIRWMPWSGSAWQQLGDAQLGLGRRAAARTSLREAARLSPHDASIWFDLGTAEAGEARRAAYRRAAELNPLDPTIELRRKTR